MLKIIEGVLEYPRIVKSAAADAHAGTAGFVKHPFGGLRRDDIAIADDWNPVHGLHDGANAGKFYRAAKTLFARPAMYENRSRPGVFERARQIRRGNVPV